MSFLKRLLGGKKTSGSSETPDDFPQITRTTIPIPPKPTSSFEVGPLSCNQVLAKLSQARPIRKAEIWQGEKDGEPCLLGFIRKTKEDCQWLMSRLGEENISNTSWFSIAKKRELLHLGKPIRCLKFDYCIDSRFQMQQQLFEDKTVEVWKAWDQEKECAVICSIFRPEDCDKALKNFAPRQLSSEESTMFDYPGVLNIVKEGLIYPKGPFTYYRFKMNQLYYTITKAPSDYLIPISALPRRKFAWDEGVSVLYEVGRALYRLHEKGWVHGQINPRQILLGEKFERDCHIHLNCASIVSPQIDSLSTAFSIWHNTPRYNYSNYFAPESVSQTLPTPQGDQFLLGLSVYHLISGKNPVSKAGTSNIKKMVTEITPLNEVVSSVPKWFAEIIQRTLAVNPEDRYPDMKAMAEDLVAQVERDLWDEDSEISSDSEVSPKTEEKVSEVAEEKAREKKTEKKFRRLEPPAPGEKKFRRLEPPAPEQESKEKSTEESADEKAVWDEGDEWSAEVFSASTEEKQDSWEEEESSDEGTETDSWEESQEFDENFLDSTGGTWEEDADTSWEEEREEWEEEELASSVERSANSFVDSAEWEEEEVFGESGEKSLAEEDVWEEVTPKTAAPIQARNNPKTKKVQSQKETVVNVSFQEAMKARHVGSKKKETPEFEEEEDFEEMASSTSKTKAQMDHYIMCYPHQPFLLEKDKTFRMGRDSTNDLSLASEAISRFHATINWERKGFVLRDLESSNGTLVNGDFIKEHRLKKRDKIVIGSYTIVYQEIPQGRRLDKESKEILNKKTIKISAMNTFAEIKKVEEASFSGDLSQLSLWQVTQMLAGEEKSGCLVIEAPDKEAKIFYANGMIVHCEGPGKGKGAEVFYNVVNWQEGRFSFNSEKTPSEISMSEAVESLLFEAARRIDEENR